jgi:hypothetical protein
MSWNGSTIHSAIGPKTREFNMAPAQYPQQIKEFDHSISREERIRKRAYQFYLARGREPGKELEDWVRAEQEFEREQEAARLWQLGH